MKAFPVRALKSLLECLVDLAVDVYKKCKEQGMVTYESTVEIDLDFDVDRDGELQIGADAKADLESLAAAPGEVSAGVSRKVTTSKDSMGTVKIRQTVKVEKEK